MKYLLPIIVLSMAMLLFSQELQMGSSRMLGPVGTPGPAVGVLTHVANDGNGSCSSDVSTTCAISYTPNAAGNPLIIVGTMFVGVSGVTLSTVTDNGATGGSTYTCDVNGTTPVGTGNIFWMCRTLSAKSSVTTITFTFSAAGVSHYPGVSIMEFHDTATATFDQVSSSATGTGTTVTSAALTPAVTGELSIMGILQTAGNFAYTGTNGWTCANKVDPNSNQASECWQIISGTSSTAATATGSNIQWAAYQALYKP